MKYSIASALLLPVTLVSAFMVIAKLPEAPEGDTSFAWLPFLLAVPVLISMIAMVITSLLKKTTLQLIVGLGLPIILYGASYVIVGVPGDGIPRDALSTSIWFGSLLVCLSPNIVFIVRKKLGKS